MSEIQSGDLLIAYDGTVARVEEQIGGAWHVRFIDSQERPLIGCVGEIGPQHLPQWRKVDLGRWTQADIDEIRRRADEMYGRVTDHLQSEASMSRRGGRLPDPGEAGVCARCGEPRLAHGGPKNLGACPGEHGLHAKRYQLADEDKALDADVDEGAGT